MNPYHDEQGKFTHGHTMEAHLLSLDTNNEEAKAHSRAALKAAKLAMRYQRNGNIPGAIGQHYLAAKNHRLAADAHTNDELDGDEELYHRAAAEHHEALFDKVGNRLHYKTRYGLEAFRPIPKDSK